MTTTPNTRLCRLLRLLPAAGGLFAAIAGANPVAAQQIEADQAPPAWVVYAQAAGVDISARLSGPAPEAERLRDYMLQSAAPSATGPARLVLAVWIDATGTITRLSFTPFAHPGPNADLDALLTGYRLSEPPPEGMLQPLRIAVELKPEPGSEPSQQSL